LQPEVSHFVYRTIAGENALWRVVGIGDIPGRVVIGIAHGDDSAAWKRERLSQPEYGLPVEVPARDVDKSFGCGAGELRCSEHIAAEIVGMRVESEELDVPRKSEGIFDHELWIAGRNIERAIVFELQKNGKVSGRFAGEINADGGLDGFGFAGRLEMRVEDEIVAGVETEGEPGRFNDRGAAWLPKKKMAIGVEGFGFDLQLHTGEAAAGRFFLAAGGLGAVHKEIGVMYEALVARMDFDGFDETGSAEGGSENKIPVDIAAAGGNFKRSGGVEDEIGLTELPAGSEMRSGRNVASVAFGSAAVEPFLEECDFGV